MVDKNNTVGGEEVIHELLEYIGEDPARGGLVDTPQRAFKAWKFWTSGYDQDPLELLKTFEDGAERYDQLVFQGNIPVYSHCEHHMAPFFGVAHVAYIPNKKVIGLSKISRLIDVFARRLQVQERITTQVADSLATFIEPLGVGVVLRCRHMCMESRGIQKAGTVTYTNAVRGAFKEESSARAEFMDFVRMADVKTNI